MYASLDCLAEGTRKFLEKVLPQCSDNWWEACVVSQLSFQQQRIAEEKEIRSLAGLDLAGVLRVMDRNWHDINLVQRLPREVRNWLKEAQSIRNRWAHMPPNGHSDDDKFRDIDTTLRLLNALGAESSLVRRVSEAREEVLTRVAQHERATSENIQQIETLSVEESTDVIAIGTIVRLVARPEQTGAVINVMRGGSETRYTVFSNGVPATYYESQIELVLDETSADTSSIDLSALHSRLTALQIQNPSTQHLYSLRSSRIQFVPYQFRPVVKLIQSDRPRLLIADEVGVGKTIEAGLILKELQARREIKSVLVICPKPLVVEKKWQEELKRFDEDFVHLDGQSLRYCLDETSRNGVWPNRYAKVILPYSLLDESLVEGIKTGTRARPGLQDLDPPITFDLVIVDEAHHVRNPETWAHRAVRYFCDNAEATVLLTATPVQMGSNDLFNLLHLLRPDLVPTRQNFELMAEPNPYLNAAIEMARGANDGWQEVACVELEKAAATSWGRGVLATDSSFQDVYDRLSQESLDNESRLATIRQLEQLYTFSGLINRTRRRDIGNFTVRKPETIVVEFTPEQAELYHDLLDFIGRILAYQHGSENLKFLMTTVRRQLASCVHGFAPLMQAVLDHRLSQLEVSELDSADELNGTSDILANFNDEVYSLINKAQSLTGPDPKFDAFIKVLRDKQNLPNNKLLVFSSFRHTLAYLKERLEQEGVRVGLIHGGIADDDRRSLRNRFSNVRDASDAIDVLLSSEVGCEGLDYQFCDGIVNYDLPWNPMRIEQRIGRIDRYGQKSDTVAIYNMITPGTVDADIYERCLLRIGVFRQALGGSEEILGRLTREIQNIGESFTLTSVERAERLQQLADNEIRAIQELDALEQEQTKFFGLDIPKRDEEMIRESASFWLTPEMLMNMVRHYLTTISAIKFWPDFKKRNMASLQVNQESRNKLLKDYQSQRGTGAAWVAWERWLKGSDPYLSVTFDADVADGNRELMFITPTHPLVRQAADFATANLKSGPSSRSPVCNFIVKTATVPSGYYPYAIYFWSKLGLKDDFEFHVLCDNPELEKLIPSLMDTAQSEEVFVDVNTAQAEALERLHYRLWSSARAEHIQNVQETVKARISSLKQSHSSRLALLEDQRDSASDARIRRMRSSQIEGAHADFSRRLDELKGVLARAEILTDQVAIGMICVEQCDG